MGGAALETGAALVVGAGLAALNDPAPSVSTQRKRSSSSMTQVWLIEQAGKHSVRRHNPLLRSQAKPGVQFAQHPPVVARYTAVAPSVAPRPMAACVY